jgi:hypothetical protein
MCCKNRRGGDSGELKVENGELKVESGELKVESGEWRVQKFGDYIANYQYL